jgi:hypothetical protein
MISELNVKSGGVLCKENEIVFIEIKRLNDDD